mgnify:FL=1
MKLLYIMRDPFGLGGVKIGITGFKKAKMRLGTYQNSFPGKSHLATFNKIWYGKNIAISELERVLKNQFDYAIELDGRGFTEWAYEDEAVIEEAIKTTIQGYGFHVFPVDTDGETVYTIDKLIGKLEVQHGAN